MHLHSLLPDHLFVPCRCLMLRAAAAEFCPAPEGWNAGVHALLPCSLSAPLWLWWAMLCVDLPMAAGTALSESMPPGMLLLHFLATVKMVLCCCAVTCMLASTTHTTSMPTHSRWSGLFKLSAHDQVSGCSYLCPVPDEWAYHPYELYALLCRHGFVLWSQSCLAFPAFHGLHCLSQPLSNSIGVLRQGTHIANPCPQPEASSVHQGLSLDELD